MAAVRVVLPWSMWPIVPTLTCGLVRVKVSLAIALLDALRHPLGSSDVLRRGPAQPPHTPPGPLRAIPRGLGPAAGLSIAPPELAWARPPKSCLWDSNPGPRPYQGRA